MQLHTGYFGTLDNESAYSVDTVPTGMVVTDTVQFYLPDDGKMFTNGIVITDILIVGQDVIEDYGEVDDSGYVSILTKVNGKALFRDIMLTASDVSALSSSTTINDLTTTGQQDALNSGITSSDVSLIGTALQPNDNISELNNDTGYISGITSSDVTAALGYTPYSSSNPNGYQANVIEVINVNGTAQTITSKTVDITVPTDNSQISNGAGYITGITSGDVTNALGYTPYNGTTNPNGYTSNVGTVTSVNNTQPDSNGDVTIPIPTVNDATLTINQGGTQKGTFSANASSDVTINLDGNQRNIGEIVPSTIPLTDAGLHLLDGSLISGSGIYSDFVNYIADLCNNSSKVSNVTKVGSLTDNNGVLSGFSADNYALLPRVFSPTTSWEMVWKVTASDYSINSSRILGCYLENYKGCSLGFYGSKLCAWLGNADTSDSWNVGILTGTTTLVNNQTYYVKLEFTGTAYNLYLSTDGTTYNLEATLTSSAIISTQNPHAIGINRWNNTTGYNGILSGSIDLKESYININGSRWWTGANPSWATDETAWQASVTQYGVCGKFVYDSTNNTVRLPKITGIVEGTTDLTALGDLVEAGLPNITGATGQSDCSAYTYNPYNTGAFYTGGESKSYFMGRSGESSNTWGLLHIDASRSSSIYGNSTTVQPQTIKILYYIVVATTAKTEIQVNIDEIATDLNGKMDTDFSNMSASQSVKNTIISWTMPDYSAGVSITSYTSSSNKFVAPCDGIIIWGHSCAKNDRGYLNGIIFNSYGVNDIAAYTSEVIPINKGENFYATAYRDSNSLCNNFFPLKGVN